MATAQRATRPPLWRDVRVLRIAGQILFVIAVAVTLQQIWLNLEYNYNRQGISSSWDFLDSRAGFDLNESLIDYNPNQTYLRAYLAGLTNTIFLIVIPGIIAASVIGLVVGIGRLSNNWIVRKLSQIYVEALRNVPVLVIIVIFFVGVFSALPRIENEIHIPGIARMSTSGGVALTYLAPQDGFFLWLVALALGIVAWWFVARQRRKQEEESGDRKFGHVYGFGAFLAVAVVGAFALGGPVELSVPEINASGFGYEGGLQASIRLAAVVVGLVLYTSAFIAEIIRGSIQAVSKGQKEAAEALGLRPWQQLRFVVLPQALRIALPPINSQYLNLTKNSSLAIAAGFPDLAGVTKTMMNQSGRSFQVLLLVLLTYLGLSLVVSALMNVVNRAVTSRGERRG